MLEKFAVMKGGGLNHRYNLSDEILIKDNHISAEKILRNWLSKPLNQKKVTVEIENVVQLKEIIGLKFNRILFDNMSIKRLKMFKNL